MNEDKKVVVEIPLELISVYVKNGDTFDEAVDNIVYGAIDIIKPNLKLAFEEYVGGGKE